MKPCHSAPVVLLLLLAGCTHTPPGTSVEIALAKRAEVVRWAQAPQPAAAPARSAAPQTPQTAPQPDKTELVADAFKRGEFCAKAGKDDEAIAAFREAVQIDPTFVDAWTYLATLYEKAGNEKEALDAFKHAKLASNKAG